MIEEQHAAASDEKLCWTSSIPFFLLHLTPLGILWTGFTAASLALCFALFAIRMFCITAGYHRYFGHHAFRTNRVVQFLLAFGGGMAAQKGALWWGSHHRTHHRYSDQDGDIHSPKKGFWWSHMVWFLCKKYDATDYDLIPDFARYPELRFLNVHHWVPPTVAGIACFLVAGWSGLFVGFFLSTVITYHATFSINSLAHVFGSRRYATTDTSRNSLLLALLTFGEGWHNNHHHYQASARMGFYWWEIDLTYYGLWLMARLGLVWDLRQPPERSLLAMRIDDGHVDVALEPASFGASPSQASSVG